MIECNGKKLNHKRLIVRRNFLIKILKKMNFKLLFYRQKKNRYKVIKNQITLI